jgi:hypothetical protein
VSVVFREAQLRQTRLVVLHDKHPTGSCADAEVAVERLTFSTGRSCSSSTPGITAVPCSTIATTDSTDASCPRTEPTVMSRRAPDAQEDPAATAAPQ